MWRKTVRFSLYAEKIEDGVFDVSIPLVIGYPYFLEGILIGRYWVNHYTYTFFAPTIYPPFEEREVPKVLCDCAVLLMAVVPLS